MSFPTLEKIRSILRSGRSPGGEDEGGDGKPEVGFKVVHNGGSGEVTVKVIAARNLPACYGSVKPEGYLVKVKVFPGREKYETEIQKNANPYFNQEFRFPINGQLSGKFVTLTVYSILEQSDRSSRLSKRGSFRDKIENFIGLNREPSTKRSNEVVKRSSSRFLANNRRTVGAVTYNLNKGSFTVDLKNRMKATPDIWRTVENISSGMGIDSRESKKGSLEVTMSYSNSENGKNDMVQVSLSKWRCGMQTMQEQEKLKGHLYFKMAVYEYDVLVGKWKGSNFQPTISMKIDKSSATMSAVVNSYNIDRVKVEIKLKCKNSLAKKTELGVIVLNSSSHEMWLDVIDSPTVPVTKMLDFV